MFYTFNLHILVCICNFQPIRLSLPVLNRFFVTHRYPLHPQFEEDLQIILIYPPGVTMGTGLSQTKNNSETAEDHKVVHKILKYLEHRHNTTLHVDYRTIILCFCAGLLVKTYFTTRSVRNYFRFHLKCMSCIYFFPQWLSWNIQKQKIEWIFNKTDKLQNTGKLFNSSAVFFFFFWVFASLQNRLIACLQGLSQVFLKKLEVCMLRNILPESRGGERFCLQAWRFKFCHKVLWLCISLVPGQLFQKFSNKAFFFLHPSAPFAYEFDAQCVFSTRI